MKIVTTVATALLVIFGAAVAWKFSDWSSGVDKAKQAVIDTSRTTREQIERSSSLALQEIANASGAAKESIGKTAAEASRQSQGLETVVLRTKADVTRETVSFKNEVENSRSQLQSASKLQPEVAAIRQQLEQAISDIQAQQKALSSSEEFVKHIFSSHVMEVFNIGQSPKDHYGVVLPPKSGDRTVVFLLLKSTPIPETLQLQYHIYVQPPNSYRSFHNVVIFFWGDPPDNLKTKQMSVSYFPDKSDKQLVQSLSEHDGRVFADNEPLPKFNQPDSDFKGSSLFPIK